MSREHFPDHHLALTSAVFALIEAGVQAGGDFADIWHGALCASRMARVRPLPGGHTFQVGIRAGALFRRHELKILFHGGDHGEPCATVMLPDED